MTYILIYFSAVAAGAAAAIPQHLEHDDANPKNRKLCLRRQKITKIINPLRLKLKNHRRSLHLKLLRLVITTPTYQQHIVIMHSVIIPQKQSTMLCFLLLVMASWPWRTWAALDSSVPGVANLQQQQTKTNSAAAVSVSPQPTGLAKLREVLEHEDSTSNIHDNPAKHKDKVKYASGLWITSSSAGDMADHQQSRRKRSIDLEEEAAAAIAAATETGPRYLHHHNSPWKRRSRMNSHQSSATSKQSDKHHHVPSTSSAPDSSSRFANAPDMAAAGEPLTGHLRAAGRDMAKHMMKKRRMNGGRMYDVPQIGEYSLSLLYPIIAQIECR